MEVTLLVVTLLSLALAIGMAIVTWRVVQEERQRADARVAALEEGLAASLAANPPASAQSIRPIGAAASSHNLSNAADVASAAASATDAASEARLTGAAQLLELDETDDPDWLAQFPSSAGKTNDWIDTNGTQSSGAATIAHVNGTSTIHLARIGAETDADVRSYAADAADAPARSDVPTEPSGSIAPAARDSFVSSAADRLFTQADSLTYTSARSRGVLAMGVGAAAIVALILVLWSVGRLIAPGVDQRAGARATGATGATAATSIPALELVSLQQTRERDALTIQGVVRNPPTGATLDRLAAVVAFFDAAGQQLGSVRAPLDFRTLAPGDESPFQVTTTVPAGVTRYRVSFRRDEGTIVPHVDRRQQEAS